MQVLARPQSIYYYVEDLATISDEFTKYIETLLDENNELPR